jgi:hypothetical protein
MRNRALFVCLFAVLCSLAPSLAASAAAAPPNRAPVVVVTAQDIVSAQPGAAGSSVSPLEALRIQLIGSPAFTVVCRSWVAGSDLPTTRGAWYLGENSGQLQSATTAPGTNHPVGLLLGVGPSGAGAGAGAGAPTSPLSDLAKTVPLIGHACALTQDPSMENLAILALDIPVVILYARVAMDAVVGINGIALSLSALGPGAIMSGPLGIYNAVQILRTQAAGYIALVNQDLQAARQGQTRTAALQAAIKEHHDWTIALSEDWKTVLPKLESTGQAIGQGATEAGGAVSMGAGSAGEALNQGATLAQQAAGSAGQGAGQRALEAGRWASSVAAAAADAATQIYQQACGNLPVFLRSSCPAPAEQLQPGD